MEEGSANLAKLVHDQTPADSTRFFLADTVDVSFVGTKVAYYVSRHAGRWKAPLLVLLVLPFWISYLMRMFAWTNLLDTGGYVARALDAVSLDRPLESLGLMSGDDWLGGQPIGCTWRSHRCPRRSAGSRPTSASSCSTAQPGVWS